jgi:hypothetical protein
MPSGPTEPKENRLSRLTADQAADIAARHGLSLQDAAGLLNLADDADDAEHIASRFAAAGDPLRTVARDLFARRERPVRVNLADVAIDPDGDAA